MQELTVYTNADQLKLENIPESVINDIARAAYELYKKIKDTPKFRAEYEAWHKEQGL